MRVLMYLLTSFDEWQEFNISRTFCISTSGITILCLENLLEKRMKIQHNYELAREMAFSKFFIDFIYFF
jgi:hypothetical protein